ncbi:sprT domain-containing protein [Candidatus Peregrinibacteria bacterium]|nr:MAG: sprT domain-containing protein [Candidatus Peregrinibacteria bacterium]
MEQYNLLETGWSFRFDKATRRFGCCNYSKKEISLSRRLTHLNDDEKVKDTLLHEVAHALVGPGHGHNAVWKAQALQIGCSGVRCYTQDVVTPKGKYSATCKNCGATQQLHSVSWKKHFSSCGPCCKKYNKGRFSWEFRLEVVKN